MSVDYFITPATPRSDTFDMTIQPEPWVTDALCSQSAPDLWFPDNERPTPEVKRICRACPVAGACLDFALRTNQKHGVWAGLSIRELGRLRRAARP